MPICPLCDTAYLASEQHTCEPRSGAMSELGMTAVGLIAGAVVGSLLATVLYGLLTGSNLSGIVGFGFGAPVGGVVGAVIGARAVRPKRKAAKKR